MSQKYLQSNPIVHKMNNQQQQKANNNNQSVPSVDSKNQTDTTDEMNSQSSSQQQVCAFKFITYFWAPVVLFIVCLFLFRRILLFTFTDIIYEFIESKVIRTFEIAYEIDKYTRQKQMKYINIIYQTFCFQHIKTVLHWIDGGKTNKHRRDFIWMLMKEMIADSSIEIGNVMFDFIHI